MGKTIIGMYIAEQTLQLKSQTSMISFYNLIWNGKPLMIVWNAIASSIVECYGDGANDLDVDDVEGLCDTILHHRSIYLDEYDE